MLEKFFSETKILRKCFVHLLHPVLYFVFVDIYDLSNVTELFKRLRLNEVDYFCLSMNKSLGFLSSLKLSLVIIVANVLNFVPRVTHHYNAENYADISISNLIQE